MKDFEKAEAAREKFKTGVWKKILKEFGFFKTLLICGIAISLVMGGLEIVQPKITRYVIDTFVTGHNPDNFMPLLLFTLCFFVITSAVTFMFIQLNGRLEIHMSHRLRMRCFEKLQTLSLSFYDKNAAGWIMARMSSDINKLTGIVSWGLTELLWGVAMMIAVTAAMFSEHPKLAGVAMLTLPAIIILSVYLRKKILKVQRRVRKINSQITASYNEDIQGAKTTKTLVREKLNAEEFFFKTEKMRESSVRGILVSSILMPLVQLITSLGTGLITVYGGSSVLAGTVSLGLLVAFFSYITQFNVPLTEAADIFAEFISAQAAAERIFGLLDELPDIKDKPEIIKKYGTSLEPKPAKPPEIKGSVTFEKVSFWYKEGEPVLRGFTLTVNAGETIALVGATGAGKSTIVNLLCRFYEPKRGRILIDGIDYIDRPERWIHENLGYVLQSPHLFSGTIAENIRYGRLEASDDEITAAAKLVGAHSFISKTENGYETQTGEGGGLLSTGQKQLISFARTIVRNPKLFVLDEATSSIDTETEHKIQKAISAVLKGRTSFVVAHRLSTIRNADKIIVIENGSMIESGTHEELLAKNGHYSKLYNRQFIKERQQELHM